MNFSFLKTVWAYINKLSPEILRILVFLLLMFIFVDKNINGVKDTLEQETNKEYRLKLERELYTIDITPKINNLIGDVMDKDDKISNVLLLNYHNTLESSHGLSYRYLTGLCEGFLGTNSKPCIEYWKELDYMNYGEEIYKINISKGLFMNNVSSYREEYPKFTYLLERSGAHSVIFYPILGVEGPIGMMIILYIEPVKEITLDHMKEAIVPNIQQLAILLDYNYVKSINK